MENSAYTKRFQMKMLAMSTLHAVTFTELFARANILLSEGRANELSIEERAFTGVLYEMDNDADLTAEQAYKIVHDQLDLAEISTTEIKSSHWLRRPWSLLPADIKMCLEIMRNVTWIMNRHYYGDDKSNFNSGESIKALKTQALKAKQSLEISAKNWIAGHNENSLVTDEVKNDLKQSIDEAISALSMIQSV